MLGGTAAGVRVVGGEEAGAGLFVAVGGLLNNDGVEAGPFAAGAGLTPSAFIMPGTYILRVRTGENVQNSLMQTRLWCSTVLMGGWAI